MAEKKLKCWKRTKQDTWVKNGTRIEVSKNKNSNNPKQNHQTFIFKDTPSGNFEDVGVLTKDKLVSKNEAKGVAKRYMRRNDRC